MRNVHPAPTPAVMFVASSPSLQASRSGESPRRLHGPHLPKSTPFPQPCHWVRVSSAVGTSRRARCSPRSRQRHLLPRSLPPWAAGGTRPALPRPLPVPTLMQWRTSPILRVRSTRVTRRRVRMVLVVLIVIAPPHLFASMRMGPRTLPVLTVSPWDLLRSKPRSPWKVLVAGLACVSDL
jgi:hypothetical protein